MVASYARSCGGRLGSAPTAPSTSRLLLPRWRGRARSSAPSPPATRPASASSAWSSPSTPETSCWRSAPPSAPRRRPPTCSNASASSAPTPPRRRSTCSQAETVYTLDESLVTIAPKLTKDDGRIDHASSRDSRSPRPRHDHLARRPRPCRTAATSSSWRLTPRADGSEAPGTLLDDATSWSGPATAEPCASRASSPPARPPWPTTRSSVGPRRARIDARGLTAAGDGFIPELRLGHGLLRQPSSAELREAAPWSSRLKSSGAISTRPRIGWVSTNRLACRSCRGLINAARGPGCRSSGQERR